MQGTVMPLNENDRAELAVLNVIAESMKTMSGLLQAQTEELKGLASKVDDVQARVIRLEEAKHGRDIERLMRQDEDFRARIQALELANATLHGQIGGVSRSANWAYRLGPWAFAVAMAVFLFFEKRGG